MKKKNLLLIASLILTFAMLFSTVSLAADASVPTTAPGTGEPIVTTTVPTTEDGETEEETTNSEDYNNGYNDGYYDGYNDGYSSGYGNGFMNGFWAGTEEGNNDNIFQPIIDSFEEFRYKVISFFEGIKTYIRDLLGISYLDEDYLASAGQANLKDDEQAAALCEELEAAISALEDYEEPLNMTKTVKVDVEVTDCPGGQLTANLLNPVIENYLEDYTNTYDYGWHIQSVDLYPQALKEATKTVNADGTTDYKFVLIEESSYFDGDYTYTVDPDTGVFNSFYVLYHLYCADALRVEYFDYDPFVINHATILYPGATVTAKTDADGRLIALDIDMPLEGTCQGSVGPVTLTVDLAGYRNEGYTIEY